MRTERPRHAPAAHARRAAQCLATASRACQQLPYGTTYTATSVSATRKLPVWVERIACTRM